MQNQTSRTHHEDKQTTSLGDMPRNMPASVIHHELQNTISHAINPSSNRAYNPKKRRSTEIHTAHDSGLKRQAPKQQPTGERRPNPHQINTTHSAARETNQPHTWRSPNPGMKQSLNPSERKEARKETDRGGGGQSVRFDTLAGRAKATADPAAVVVKAAMAPAAASVRAGEQEQQRAWRGGGMEGEGGEAFLNKTGGDSGAEGGIVRIDGRGAEVTRPQPVTDAAHEFCFALSRAPWGPPASHPSGKPLRWCVVTDRPAARLREEASRRSCAIVVILLSGNLLVFRLPHFKYE